MPTPLLVANWKMHKTNTDGTEFLNTLKQQSWPTDRQAVICAPFTLLPLLQQSSQGMTLQYGAQNMHWEEHGAFTGEISPMMLTDLGCTYVIIGHSERRQYFNETDETMQKKVHSALTHNLIPIICVGETLQQRRDNITNQVIKQQLNTALTSCSTEQLQQVVIAYEPIWAIGTGEAATPAQAQAVHVVIRQFVSAATQIIYGGSVTSANIQQFMAQPDINGALIGGASLEAGTFIQLVKY